MPGDPPLHARALLSASEAEKYLGIPAATVRSWARRGRLLAVGLDARSHGGPYRSPLYQAGDLYRLARYRPGGQRAVTDWQQDTDQAQLVDVDDLAELYDWVDLEQDMDHEPPDDEGSP